jgi:hypothetical protein
MRAVGPALGSLPLTVLASLRLREQPGPDVVGRGPQRIEPDGPTEPIELDEPPESGVDLSDTLDYPPGT